MRKILFPVVLTLLPAVAWANGYAVPNLTPEDLAMAGARTAAQDSAAAAFGNPSALARIQGLNVSVAGAAIDIKSSWADPLGVEAPVDGITKLTFAPAAYASYGFRLPNDMAVGVGAGVMVPFGGNVFWPDTWPGRFDILTVERRIYGTYLSAGIEPLPWLRLGGGFIWYRGTEKFTQAVNFIGSEGLATLADSGDAFSYDLSAEIQPTEKLRLGVDYKHQGVMRLDGHAHFDNAPPQLGLVDQTVSHDLTIPNVLNAGISYQVFPILLVTGGYTWHRWVVYDQDLFVGSAGSSIAVQRKWKNGSTYRLGVEGGPVNNFKVRLGILRDISPTPSEWMQPSIPDSNVWGASVGISYAVLPTLEINASYFHAWFDQVQTCHVSGGQCLPNNVFPGIYDTRANIASLGVTWNWAAPLR